MSLERCAACQSPLTSTERQAGVCPVCKQTLAESPAGETADGRRAGQKLKPTTGGIVVLTLCVAAGAIASTIIAGGKSNAVATGVGCGVGSGIGMAIGQKLGLWRWV